MILDTFPTAEDFYKTYWGKKPFIVRQGISPALIETLVDGDTLAGQALEDDIKSRIITNSAQGNDWVCEHGPFDEDRFDDIGSENWSLLVQNVEQYHTPTAELLQHFQFSPRWLMDDVMVSFSAAGGSVGPHTDSYHTFLVQGIGRRAWKISSERIDDDCYVDNPDMKILQNGFDGETFEVSAGDVIYMPPFFGHEGKTLETAMTFSVGFLGPKLSEMLGDYAQYLEENEELNKRFLGARLDPGCAGFTISPQMQDNIRGDVIDAIGRDHFARWMASYFAVPTHDNTGDTDNLDMDERILTQDELKQEFDKGAAFYKPEHVKLAITTAPDGAFYLGVYGDVITVSAAQGKLVQDLNEGLDISRSALGGADEGEALGILIALYHKKALSLRE